MKVVVFQRVVFAFVCSAVASPIPISARQSSEPRCIERGGWYYVENIPVDVRCVSLDPKMYPRSRNSSIPRFRRGSGVFGSSIPIAPVVINDTDKVSVTGYTKFHYDPTHGPVGDLGRANDLYVEGCDETNLTSATMMSDIVCQRAASIPTPAVSTKVTSFLSELPIMTITLTDTSNNDFHLDDKRSVVWSLHYPVGHVKHDTPFVGALGMVEYSGQSSVEMSSKRGYSMEVVDASGKDLDIDMGLAGMTPEADYKLRGTLLDKTLLKDAIGLAANAATGRVSMKGSPVELYVRLDDKYADPNAVDESHYMGVYMLEEKIKQGEGRIPISKTKKSTPLNETSFIVKRDNFHEGDIQLLNGGSNTQKYVMVLEYPKPSKASPTQIDYIRNYLKRVDELMVDPYMTDEFQSLVDVRSFVDQQLVQEMLFNADAYRKSTTFYKDAKGKLTAGPLWDFDLSMGFSWDLVNASTLLQYDRYQGLWFKELNNNAEYKCLVSCIWQDYRATIFKTEAVLKLVDERIPSLRNAAERNFQRWDVLGRPLELFMGFTDNNQWLPTWEAEVVALKRFLVSRLAVLDRSYDVDLEVCDCVKIKVYVP